MLAKVWKKVLLAICIIACIYNVMSKIVYRHSLEENLKSVNDGELVFDIFSKDSESDASMSDVIDEVVSNLNTTKENTTVNESATTSTNTEAEEVISESNTSVVEENTSTTEENKSNGLSFSDFTFIF